MADFATARDRMVAAQLKRRGIADVHVLAAMGQVPREEFVAFGYDEFAYEDSALPIAEGQSISQPFIVAAMIEAAAIAPGDKVLEIGAGSGYAAAVISRMGAQVFAIERHRCLSDAAAARFQALGYDNIRLMTGDGTRGWPAEAPFDAIIVSAGGPKAPSALKDQLRIGGTLMLPVGAPSEQRLLRLVRTGKARWKEDDLGAVRFVRLIGEEGWGDAETAELQRPYAEAKL
jgi:protein-L-isoaspartate(D-aspartate) O-methyltransferase